MASQANLFHPVDKWENQKMNSFSNQLIIGQFLQFLKKVRDPGQLIQIILLKIKMERHPIS